VSNLVEVGMNPQPFSPSPTKSMLFVMIVVIGAAVLAGLGFLIRSGMQ
jgi:hypothetical protein